MRHHMRHRLRQHLDPLTTVMASITVIGLAFTVGCIIMMRTESDWSAPWHFLGIAVGIPSALCASYLCFYRAEKGQS